MKKSNGNVTAGVRPRRRNDSVRRSILVNAMMLLDQEGYGALSIEGIARRAGAGKTTIYRWWDTKAEVIMDAFVELKSRHIPVPDLGNLRADLERFMSDTFRALRETGAGVAMAALMAEAQRDRSFGKRFRTRFIASRRKVLRSILTRSGDRGEIATDLDLEVALDCLYGPMWYRLLNGHGPLNAAFAKRLVKQVTSGLCPR